MPHTLQVLNSHRATQCCPQQTHFRCLKSPGTSACHSPRRRSQRCKDLVTGVLLNIHFCVHNTVKKSCLLNQSGQAGVVSARKVSKALQTEGHLSERDTLAQAKARLQDRAHTVSSPLESQNTAAGCTSLAGSADRSHHRESEPSEDFVLQNSSSTEE